MTWKREKRWQFALTPTPSPGERGNFSGAVATRMGVDTSEPFGYWVRPWNESPRAARSRRVSTVRPAAIVPPQGINPNPHHLYHPTARPRFCSSNHVINGRK